MCKRIDILERMVPARGKVGQKDGLTCLVTTKEGSAKQLQHVKVFHEKLSNTGYARMGVIAERRTTYDYAGTLDLFTEDGVVGFELQDVDMLDLGAKVATLRGGTGMQLVSRAHSTERK